MPDEDQEEIEEENADDTEDEKQPNIFRMGKRPPNGLV